MNTTLVNIGFTNALAKLAVARHDAGAIEESDVLYDALVEKVGEHNAMKMILTILCLPHWPPRK